MLIFYSMFYLRKRERRPLTQVFCLSDNVKGNVARGEKFTCLTPVIMNIKKSNTRTRVFNKFENLPNLSPALPQNNKSSLWVNLGVVFDEGIKTVQLLKVHIVSTSIWFSPGLLYISV